MLDFLVKILHARDGATVVEYGIIVALIAVAMIISLEDMTASLIAALDFIREHLVLGDA